MRIFTIGETTYDILFRESVPVAAHSGGSAYNSSISLGRCGLPVSLISTFGTDSIGDLSYKFLTENGVNCQLIKRFEGKSRIALAFLTETTMQNIRSTRLPRMYFRNIPCHRKMISCCWVLRLHCGITEGMN